MYHFFVRELSGAEEGTIRITGPDVNHIRNVLRMKPGDKIVVSDGADRDYYCLIREITPEEVLAAVQPEQVAESELPAELFLFQGLPKSDKLEWIIQKAVELGAAGVIPVAMKRSVVKLDAKKQKTRVPRWNAIAESAAKQCGRRRIPEVTPVKSFREALAEAESLDLILVPYENEQGMKATKEALAQIHPGMKIGIFIGPEGGFEPSEIEALTALDARTISLGRRILRTETAGLTALSICMVNLELQEEEFQEGELH